MADPRLTEAIAKALKRDARLEVGWDEHEGQYGLMDTVTGVWAIYGGPDLDSIDWDTLRSTLILRAIERANG